LSTPCFVSSLIEKIVRFVLFFFFTRSHLGECELSADEISQGFNYKQKKNRFLILGSVMRHTGFPQVWETGKMKREFLVVSNRLIPLLSGMFWNFSSLTTSWRKKVVVQQKKKEKERKPWFLDSCVCNVMFM